MGRLINGRQFGLPFQKEVGLLCLYQLKVLLEFSQAELR
jgi:hypothetical protein